MTSSGSKSSTIIALTGGIVIGAAVSKLLSDRRRKSEASDKSRSLLVGTSTETDVAKLEYFNIAGVAEKVRLALFIAGVPFDDVRIKFPDWATKKPTTKYGQIPELTLPDGSKITQSAAMLRLAGAADPEGKLYPSDPISQLKIDEVIGLVDDLSKAWSPSLYVSMRPENFGYPKSDEWPKEEKDAVVKKVREDFMRDQFPRFMGYFTDLIEESGNCYLAGKDLTIADLAGLHTIMYYRRGIADHVPTESLDPYPTVNEWLDRVLAHPKVEAYYASKEN